MTKQQIEAFKKITGPWFLKPCSHGGLIVVRGDGGPGGHEQSHVQIIPESDAIAFAALPDLLAEREKMITALKEISQRDPKGAMCGNNPAECRLQCIGCAARAALAEAEGGE